MSAEILPYGQVAEEMGVSLRWVRSLVRRGTLPTAPLGYHSNGKVEYGVPRAALVAQANAAPLTPERCTLKFEGRVPLTRDGIPDVAAMHAIGLGALADEWSRRMKLVAEFRAQRQKVGYGHVAQAAQYIADLYECSVRCVYNWDKLMRDGGPAALVPAPPESRGKSCLPADLQAAVREFYLSYNRPTAKQVYRHVVLPYYDQRPDDPPAYCTVARYLKKHVLPLAEIAFRQGKEAYMKLCAPKVTRDISLLEPNDVWSVDHRLWDVMIRVPDGRGAGWGRWSKLDCPCGSGRERRKCCSVRRPYVTMIADVATAGFWGWRIGLTPTAAGVCHAVRSAILNYGVPRIFAPDNGKEFVASRLQGVNERRSGAMPSEIVQSGVWQALGVNVVRALPFSPWSKPIEAFFGAFSRQWENLVPGWTGRDAKQKPEALEAQIRRGLLLSAEQFGQVFAEQVEKWNADHVCGKRTAPALAIYKDSPRAREARPDPQTLTFLLQDRRELVVRATGIELGDGRYLSEDLAVYVGCKVQVRWDPEDAGEIYVYTPDERVLAVPCLTPAVWGEWGEANKDSKRMARAQRQYLGDLTRELKGANSIETMDPTGTFRMVADSARKGTGPRGTGTLKSLRSLSPSVAPEVQRQIAASAEAADPTPDPMEEYLRWAGHDTAEDLDRHDRMTG